MCHMLYVICYMLYFICYMLYIICLRRRHRLSTHSNLQNQILLEKYSLTQINLLRCSSNLCSSQDDIQNIFLCNDAHINMKVALIKKQISCKLIEF